MKLKDLIPGHYFQFETDVKELGEDAPVYMFAENISLPSRYVFVQIANWPSLLPHYVEPFREFPVIRVKATFTQLV